MGVGGGFAGREMKRRRKQSERPAAGGRASNRETSGQPLLSQRCLVIGGGGSEGGRGVEGVWGTDKKALSSSERVIECNDNSVLLRDPLVPTRWTLSHPPCQPPTEATRPAARVMAVSQPAGFPLFLQNLLFVGLTHPVIPVFYHQVAHSPFFPDTRVREAELVADTSKDPIRR